MKKYYIPGMFSIILLPIMCIWYFNYRGFLKEYRCYALSSVMMDNACNIVERYSFYNDSVVYKQYKLSNDLIKNKELLLDAKEELSTIFSLNNYEKGVEFIFDPTLKYATYIEVLNLTNHEKGKRMITLDKILYVNDKYYEENKIPPVVNNIDLSEEKVFIKESNLSILINLIGNYKYLLFGSFILLLFFTFKNRY
ncbi:hypothetical protein HX017_05255 [Myroides marinus]|nr:hypothetical protein [Myroides marinus]MDM1348204.1 hypothetical protein [Myroides marinus]MDM1364358.1 hypothetical protein [Myroides marinus]MDM1380305.1 hypothetical protein [Myroides marinus]MDM1387565.1 hypothetical protein [Myroides marinus]MDM1394789.1 hypothetical protein [Myroides marinus]